MEFLNPASLWLLLLGIVPVVLYLVRRRSAKLRVSTLAFFKTLAKEHRESSWLRRLKRWLSLAMTLALLAIAVLVLARPALRREGEGGFRSLVVLLDRSASMDLRDAEGESRLEAAKGLLRERLAGLPEEVGVALVAYDARPDVLLPRTTKRRELISGIESVSTRPVAARSDTAAEMARVLAGLEPPTAIWHFSDRPLAPGLAEGLALEEVDLALPEVKNAAITAVSLRGVPLEHARYDLFVKVALNRDAPSAAEARLSVFVGGIPSQTRELELEPGEESSVSLRVAGSRDQLLRIALETEGDDFPLDDEVVVPLPEIRPVLAAWIRRGEEEDPYTRLALSAIQESGAFELLKGGPEAWPLSEQVDAVVFDGWLPPEWPEGMPAVVINPPDAAGTLAARRLASPIPHDGVRVGEGEHPVLFRVSSGRVAVTQTALFEMRSGLRPLWFAGADPILAAGEVGGARVVVMGFSPGLSDRLPLTASFPILMGNALFWLVEPAREEIGVRLLRTGQLASLEGAQLRWTEREGRSSRTRTIPISSSLVEIDRVGVWETDAGLRGGAALLSAAESDLRSAPPQEGEAQAEAGRRGRLPREPMLWMLAAALAVLLAESWLFHRHAVY
jgi:hypothetical protein